MNDSCIHRLGALAALFLGFAGPVEAQPSLNPAAPLEHRLAERFLLPAQPAVLPAAVSQPGIPVAHILPPQHPAPQAQALCAPSKRFPWGSVLAN